jgi:hypothetical protein
MKKQIFLLLLSFLSTVAFSQTVGLIQHDNGTLDDGYVLFAPINGYTTYLIDKCGKQVKTWTSNYKPGQSVYILEDGSLLRTGNANNTTFNAGGKGGIIEKIDWNGNLIWSYVISDASNCQHHDIKSLPNGNILAIVWEKKTIAEAIAQGRNPNLISSSVWSEKIIEIQPVGSNTGNIVWEWHLWDHLIQDFDNTKPNFGAIAANPQLINLNYAATANTEDWQHINAIDYNPSLDQIVLSSHNSDEIWIIDHSTSTEQAATNTGGNSKKGGSIIYRWGNPQSYGNGIAADQKLFGQHNAYWIPSGYPNENQIMVFNNGNGRTGGNYSTVEIINPPTIGFEYTPTLPFLPISATWLYNQNNSQNWYAQNISSAQQLSNGNLLLCNGPTGTFFEINTSGTTLWKYINPVNTNGIINQDLIPTQNIVFRASFYPRNYIGFNNHIFTTGSIIENSNLISNSCNLSLSIVDKSFTKDIVVYPNPVKEALHITILDSNITNVIIKVINSLGQILIEKKANSNPITIPTDKLTPGIYFVTLFSEQNTKTFKIILKK